MDFNKKQKGGPFGNKFFLKTAGILFLVAALVLIFYDFKLYQKKKELLGQIDFYKNQIEAIEKRNAELKEGAARSDDAGYIEKVAREELDMQKQGEKVVAFIMSKEKQDEENQQRDLWSTDFWFSWLSGIWQWLTK